MLLMGRSSSAWSRASVNERRWFLAIVLLALNVLDVVMTRRIIGLGGAEVNPLLKPIIDGAAAPLMIKVMLALLIGVLLLRSPQDRHLVDRATGAACMIYTVVVGWNVVVLVAASRGAG